MQNSKNWLPEEDEALRILYVDRNIRRWTEISKILEEEFKIMNKNPKKCRQRFNNHINPDINRQDWTTQQENILIYYQRQMGNKWADIARKLPGRTDNFVKNKFYSMLRHSIRAINQLASEYKIQKYREVKMSCIYKIIAVIDYKFKYETSDVEEDLIQLAQRIKSDIMNFQRLDKTNEPEMRLSLTKIFRNLKLINIYFKKKIVKRKRSRFSEIVNNEYDMESIEVSIDEADLEKAQEIMHEVKLQQSPSIHERMMMVVQTPPIKRSIRKKKQAGIIASIESLRSIPDEGKFPQWPKIQKSTQNGPWGTHFFQQEHLDYYG